MTIILLGRVKHNFDTHEAGSTLDLPDAEAQALINAGAAKLPEQHIAPVKVKPKPQQSMQEQTKPLAEMTRDELEYHAEALGMDGPFDNVQYPNKAALVSGIKAFKETH